MKTNRLFLLAGFAFVFCACEAARKPAVAYEPREGDVVFQSFPHNPLTDAIEGVTESPLSHCGIVRRSDAGWVVIEAVEPVRETPLAEWIRRGREGRYLVFRLKESHREKIPAFLAAARRYLGRPYDIRYRLDDEKIYCSELLYKAFRDAGGGKLGRLQKLGDLNWRPQEAFIRELEGGDVPKDREMITPRGVSEATQLEKVYEGGS